MPVREAAGRIAAELVTPYPPGVPAVVPGVRITEPVLRYLRSGAADGMILPDPASPDVGSLRVVAG